MVVTGSLALASAQRNVKTATTQLVPASTALGTAIQNYGAGSTALETLVQSPHAGALAAGAGQLTDLNNAAVTAWKNYERFSVNLPGEAKLRTRVNQDTQQISQQGVALLSNPSAAPSGRRVRVAFRPEAARPDRDPEPLPDPHRRGGREREPQLPDPQPWLAASLGRCVRPHHHRVRHRDPLDPASLPHPAGRGAPQRARVRAPAGPRAGAHRARVLHARAARHPTELTRAPLRAPSSPIRVERTSIRSSPPTPREDRAARSCRPTNARRPAAARPRPGSRAPRSTRVPTSSTATSATARRCASRSASRARPSGSCTPPVPTKLHRLDHDRRPGAHRPQGGRAYRDHPSLQPERSPGARDPLTGLLNRRSLEAAVHDLAAEAHPYAVAYGDLDHFKLLNDIHGHDAGDRACASSPGCYATACDPTTSPPGTVARSSSSSLPDCTSTEAHTVIDRVRARLADAHAADLSPRSRSASG